eukprot:UC1_evm1s2202
MSSGPFTSGRRRAARRNLIAFWLFGLCNNYAYVIMLSGAHDILALDDPGLGTGIVLLAVIIPSILIKTTAPLWVNRISYASRVLYVTAFALLSFLVVALAPTTLLRLVGVACASISSGFGEVLFLSMASFYHQDVVSTWSSGTGAAGIVGALSYLLLTMVMSPAQAILSMLFVPLVLSWAYFSLLTYRPARQRSCTIRGNTQELSSSSGGGGGGGYDPNSGGEGEGGGLGKGEININNTDDTNSATATANYLGSPLKDNGGATSASSSSMVADEVGELPWRDKLKFVQPLIRPYMAPLFLVYVSEYLINQGLYEHIFWADEFIDSAAQYRVYQTLYQAGVFASRSSVSIMPLKHIWTPAKLQFINLILLALDTRYQFITSIWIVFAFVLYEGCLGGLTYVNAFYLIANDVPPGRREFSMGIASIADTFGIAVAAILAVVVNSAFVNVPARHRSP